MNQLKAVSKPTLRDDESSRSMSEKFLMMSGITKEDRHQVTADVNNAISTSGGWIVDHTLFSNIAIAIRFSLPSERLDDFRHRVIAAGVRLDDESLLNIQAMVEGHMSSPVDLTASLNITFIHDEPDLRREIPSAPG